PTSITDAYALMKVLSSKYSERHFKLLVNLASSLEEGNSVFRQLSMVANRFLDISIEYLGCVLFDKNVTIGVRHQKIVSEIYPETQASRSFTCLARTICESSKPHFPKGDSNFFWEHLLRGNFD
ncbi:MAG: flagellar synthesis regulator FleN, partial [Thermodesulfobacteriota bacterium]|nr:flagellar synthesis regulator FleN [Thermodesulfobacteriota bacterium]